MPGPSMGAPVPGIIHKDFVFEDGGWKRSKMAEAMCPSKALCHVSNIMTNEESNIHELFVGTLADSKEAWEAGCRGSFRGISQGATDLVRAVYGGKIKEKNKDPTLYVAWAPGSDPDPKYVPEARLDGPGRELIQAVLEHLNPVVMINKVREGLMGLQADQLVYSHLYDANPLAQVLVTPDLKTKFSPYGCVEVKDLGEFKDYTAFDFGGLVECMLTWGDQDKEDVYKWASLGGKGEKSGEFEPVPFLRWPFAADVILLLKQDVAPVEDILEAIGKHPFFTVRSQNEVQNFTKTILTCINRIGKDLQKIIELKKEKKNRKKKVPIYKLLQNAPKDMTVGEFLRQLRGASSVEFLRQLQDASSSSSSESQKGLRDGSPTTELEETARECLGTMSRMLDVFGGAKEEGYLIRPPIGDGMLRHIRNALCHQGEGSFNGSTTPTLPVHSLARLTPEALSNAKKNGLNDKQKAALQLLTENPPLLRLQGEFFNHRQLGAAGLFPAAIPLAFTFLVERKEKLEAGGWTSTHNALHDLQGVCFARRLSPHWPEVPVLYPTEAKGQMKAVSEARKLRELRQPLVHQVAPPPKSREWKERKKVTKFKFCKYGPRRRAFTEFPEEEKGTRAPMVLFRNFPTDALNKQLAEAYREDLEKIVGDEITRMSFNYESEGKLYTGVVAVFFKNSLGAARACKKFPEDSNAIDDDSTTWNGDPKNPLLHNQKPSDRDRIYIYEGDEDCYMWFRNLKISSSRQLQKMKGIGYAYTSITINYQFTQDSSSLIKVLVSGIPRGVYITPDYLADFISTKLGYGETAYNAELDTKSVDSIDDSIEVTNNGNGAVYFVSKAIARKAVEIFKEVVIPLGGKFLTLTEAR